VFSRWTESDEWILDLNQIRQLEQYAENPDLQREFFEAKKE